jgi:hypothetical protein
MIAQRYLFSKETTLVLVNSYNGKKSKNSLLLIKEINQLISVTPKKQGFMRTPKG